ncbi:MAG: hypothetical protein HY420_03855 [Candidatus Kerfeldbacteria bacterium]|nr:hypothetical protein [Candidatus Kerfeldbacteria bacterium]
MTNRQHLRPLTRIIERNGLRLVIGVFVIFSLWVVFIATTKLPDDPLSATAIVSSEGRVDEAALKLLQTTRENQQRRSERPQSFVKDPFIRP